jgi:TonB family protein
LMRALGIVGIAALSILGRPAAGQSDVLPDSTPAVPINSRVMTAADYPADSVRQLEEGTVFVRYLINETGDVNDCSVAGSSGHVRLDSAACALVRRWKYKPATEGGKATTQITTANIVFRIPDRPATLPPAPSDPSVLDPTFDVPDGYVPLPRIDR